MKNSLSRLLLSISSLMIVILLSACFKPYVIEETMPVNPTIMRTMDFAKVDRAVKETTTEETTTEVIKETAETELIETTESIDETTKESAEETTTVEETTKKTVKETIKEITYGVESIGVRTFVPTAPNTPAPNKNPNILKDDLTTMLNNKGWTYGKSPVSWIYVRPNTKIVSNYRPNGSVKYQITSDATSGEYGCYLPIFSGTNNVDEYYEGRFYCYDDYSKSTPDGFRFTNGLEDFKIEGIKILDILKYKYPEMLELKKGLYMNGEEYINIVYVKDIYDILNNK